MSIPARVPLDSVLVVRPKAARKETQEVVTGATYVPPPGHQTFWPYWNMAQGPFYTSSYPKEKVIIRVEFSLYGTKDEDEKVVLDRRQRHATFGEFRETR
jgi:hypothetical protein